MKIAVIRQTKISRLILLCAIVAGFVLAPGGSARAEVEEPIGPEDFTQMALQGFGDRHNSYAWSMAWWKGKLYVGTGRDTQCVQQATAHLFYPTLVSYPPQDPDIECTQSPQDLPLQAEIWRWTPESDTWDRVYVSPQDVAIDGFPGKFVARDIGFRSMVVYTEPDGTEALYVGGISSRTFNPGVPPPQILRSTDGINFAPIPQEPGTFLGDMDGIGFRSMVVYGNRIFAIATEGYAGYGWIYEGFNPAAGNDGWRLAFSRDLTAFQLATHQGYLWVGTGTNALAWPPDPERSAFNVLRTTAIGNPPYSYSSVIEDGGYSPVTVSRSVVSMHPFQGDLYVGTDRPAELYRINSDDSWDLIMGTARWTPIGIKYPTSGIETGFGNRYNIHVWRMQTHGGHLYVGTMDQSTKWRTVEAMRERLEPIMGFDLYRSADGDTYEPISTNGFGDMFSFGVRNFASTPFGLILGTANHFFGTTLWRLDLPPGIDDIPGGAGQAPVLFLPQLQSSR